MTASTVGRPVGFTVGSAVGADGVSGGTPNEGTSEYRRPGGTDKYLRPDGTSLFKRPAEFNE